MSDIEQISVQVREFVLKTFPSARRIDLTDDHPLLEEGVVDSMGILEIVGFLENELNIVLSDEDILADNFESIGQIAQFVHNRQNVPSN